MGRRSFQDNCSKGYAVIVVDQGSQRVRFGCISPDPGWIRRRLQPAAALVQGGLSHEVVRESCPAAYHGAELSKVEFALQVHFALIQERLLVPTSPDFDDYYKESNYDPAPTASDDEFSGVLGNPEYFDDGIAIGCAAQCGLAWLHY